MALPDLALHRSTASPWRVVEAELDAWATAGRVARLWWRDDDAVAPSSALDRLLALAGDAPLALAVIPQGIDPELARRLDGNPNITVAQHGIAHENHAPAGAKRVELMSPQAIPGLTEGAARLADLFGAQNLPVLVPPWNRIAPELVPLLTGCGFTGLSSFGPRRRPLAARGLAQVNTHVDPVDWTRRRSRDVADFATGLADTLALQRLGQMDAGEPLGLLTHHRLDDRGIEGMIADLASIVANHPAACWIGLAEAMAG
ncbi:MAG: hypothetical protein WDN69_37045 [Aliidongia sp.]